MVLVSTVANFNPKVNCDSSSFVQVPSATKSNPMSSTAVKNITDDMQSCNRASCIVRVVAVTLEKIIVENSRLKQFSMKVS